MPHNYSSMTNLGPPFGVPSAAPSNHQFSQYPRRFHPYNAHNRRGRTSSAHRRRMKHYMTNYEVNNSAAASSSYTDFSHPPAHEDRWHIAWHDTFENSNWISVMNLPNECTKDDVLSLFSRYGAIDEVKLIYDEEKRIKFCFLNFLEHNSSVLAEDDSGKLQISGQSLYVDHIHSIPTENREVVCLDNDQDILTEVAETSEPETQTPSSDNEGDSVELVDNKELSDSLSTEEEEIRMVKLPAKDMRKDASLSPEVIIIPNTDSEVTEAELNQTFPEIITLDSKDDDANAVVQVDLISPEKTKRSKKRKKKKKRAIRIPAVTSTPRGQPTVFLNVMHKPKRSNKKGWRRYIKIAGL